MARTDVYHVLFAKAAVGKASQLADYLKAQPPNAPMPGHFIVLRHQEGDDWDYVLIDHLGTKATVQAAGTPIPQNVREAIAWHGDTFVSGPPWPEFAKAMGIGGGAATANSAYIVGVFRAAPGAQEGLEKALSASPRGASQVLLQHLEGGPWQYLTISRYNSWQDLGADEASTTADMRKDTTGKGPWFQLRDYSSFHRDTLADRIAP
jgi:hypothetical protein